MDGFGNGQQSFVMMGLAAVTAPGAGAAGATGLPSTVGQPGMMGMSAADMRCCQGGMSDPFFGGTGFSPAASGMSGLPMAMMGMQIMAMQQLLQMTMLLMMALLKGRSATSTNPYQVPGLRGGTDGGGTGAASGREGGASANGASGADGTGKIKPGDGSQPAVMRQGKRIGANLASAFDQMVAAAKKDGVDLRIVSGYRTHEEQQRLWNANPNPRMVARPGTSNHEKGNAIDFANTPGAYAWLKANATKFGLHNYPVEAWHYSTDGH